MYDFRKVDELVNSKPFITSEALYLFSQKKTLDELVSGFTTLRVKGINEIKQASNIAELPTDGGFFLSSRLESREIEVTFMLRSNTPQELVEKQSAINRYLYSGLKKFTFLTMPNWYYEGVFTSIEYEEGTLNPTGTIHIMCPSPYRYSVDTIEIGLNEALNASEIIGGKYYPERLEMQLESTDSLALGGTLKGSDGKKLIFITSYPDAPQKWVLDFKSANLKVDGVNKSHLIDIQSDVSSFYLKKGDKLTVDAGKEVGTDLTMIFRRREVG